MEKGVWRKEKGERRREKGEGRREKGEGRREKGKMEKWRREKGKWEKGAKRLIRSNMQFLNYCIFKLASHRLASIGSVNCQNASAFGVVSASQLFLSNP